MIKGLALLLLVTLGTCYHVRENHEYWYTANRKAAQTNVPYADVAWNYCDYKCTSLEKFVTGVDFYIINFRESTVKPNFSACYGKSLTGSVKLWNTYLSNSFYESQCGSDSEDYLTNSKYTKLSEEGTGIGTLFSY